MHAKQMQRFVVAMFFLGAGAPAMAETTGPAAPPARAVEAAPAATAERQAGLDNTFSAFGLLSYWYAESGVGVGARFQKTVAPEGLLHLAGVHDDVGLEGGADYAHYSFIGISYNEVALLFGGVWNFWFLQDRLALYPKVDLGYRFGSWSGASLGGYGGLVFQGSAGVAYRLARLTLRAEAGSGSLRLGAGFAF
ncbi:MAG TPA: hypothetical protein VKB80_11850 [Kofleriaceae bacterium]|nr:hypothetical protein [Kofleriaceae bacterium]